MENNTIFFGLKSYIVKLAASSPFCLSVRSLGKLTKHACLIFVILILPDLIEQN